MGCPDSADFAPAPCQPGLICDYRKPGALPTCVTRLECAGAPGKGSWSMTNLEGSCTAMNGASCPATFATTAEGSDCTPSQESTCTYDEGVCRCESCSLGAGPSARGVWTCRPWASGGQDCPSESPLAGTACGMPDQFCGYGGFCSIPVGYNYHCVNGYWQPVQTPLGTCAFPLCPEAKTCGFSTAPAVPAAAAPGASAEAQATAIELAKYDALIGRFLRGDVKVYTGTVGAMTTVADTGGPTPHTATNNIADGPALAMLDVRPTAAYDWTPSLYPAPPAGSQTAVLVVHHLPTHSFLVFGQRQDLDPDVTWSGVIRRDSAENALTRSCMGCVPRFASGPSSLSFDRALTTGKEFATAANGAQMSVDVFTGAQASLDALAPCTLRWPDLATLNTSTGPAEISDDPGLGRFMDGGDEMVRHDGGALGGPTMRGTCADQTLYTIDLWVKKADLAAHGVRNFQVVDVVTTCTS
jgi:hypothetical protein